MQTTQCPSCNSDVIIEDEMNDSDLVTCANCGEELEIISVHPIQVAKLSQEEN